MRQISGVAVAHEFGLRGGGKLKAEGELHDFVHDVHANAYDGAKLFREIPLYGELHRFIHAAGPQARPGAGAPRWKSGVSFLV